MTYLPRILVSLYPNAVPLDDFVLQDDSDGNGPYIKAWNAEKLGPAPTAETIASALAAPEPAAAVPAIVSDRQFFQQLALMGIISEKEALAAVGPGTLPAALAAMIESLPPEQ